MFYGEGIGIWTWSWNLGQHQIGDEDVKTWEDSEIWVVQTCTDASQYIKLSVLVSRVGRCSWSNLESYIRDILYVILNSRLRCFDLIQGIGIRCVAWSKQCLERLICLPDRFIQGETWVREDLWGICFIEQTWDAMNLN